MWQIKLTIMMALIFAISAGAQDARPAPQKNEGAPAAARGAKAAPSARTPQSPKIWSGETGQKPLTPQTPAAKKQAARIDTERGWEVIKLGRGPANYNAIFASTLAGLAEHFETIDYANRYDGRIEAGGKIAGTPGFIRKAAVTIQPCAGDGGGYAIQLCIDRIKEADPRRQAEPKAQIVGRDVELEKVILKRLNAQAKTTEGAKKHDKERKEPDVPEQPRQPQPAPKIMHITPLQAERLLEQAFGEKSDVARLSIKLLFPAVFVATNTVVIEKDGNASFTPFQAVLFGRDKNSRITLVISERAVVTFDRPIGKLADLDSRTIVGTQFSGKTDVRTVQQATNKIAWDLAKAKSPVLTGEPFLHMYPVPGGNAAAVAILLQEIFPAPATRIAAVGANQIAVWADPQTQMAIAKQRPLAPGVTVVIALDPLNAASIAGTLKGVFGGPKDGGPIIEAENISNSLLVRGTAEQVDEIKQVLTTLSKNAKQPPKKGEPKANPGPASKKTAPPPRDARVWVYSLEDLGIKDGSSLRQVITRAVEPSSWSAAGGQGSVEYLPEAKTLVVRQSVEVIREVEDLLRQLMSGDNDEQATDEQKKPATKVVHLSRFANATAEPLAKETEELQEKVARAEKRVAIDQAALKVAQAQKRAVEAKEKIVAASLDTAKASIAEREAQFRRRELELQRTKILRGQAVVAQQEVVEAELQMKAAQGQLMSAQALFAETEAKIRFAQQETAVEEARCELAQAKLEASQLRLKQFRNRLPQKPKDKGK